MSCKRFLYAIILLVLLMHTVAAAPAVQSLDIDVVQALITAAGNADYPIDSSQIQTVTLPNGGSVANYALVDSVDASNPLQAGVPVALQYWASPDLTGFVVVQLTSVSQQALEFTLLDSTNNIVGIQTVPTGAGPDNIIGTQTVLTGAGANNNAVRRDITIKGRICVRIFRRTFCITWIIIIRTPVVPPPTVQPVTVQPVTVQPVTVQLAAVVANSNQLAANQD